MIEEVTALTPKILARYDEIIDVRSPAEFAEDHAPGAVNLPVLNNEQRVEVGTLYVQKSKFLASRVGAAIVSRNIADHLEGHLADKPGGYAPLIYCWRGGNRSGAMATILSRVGWRVGLLSGGYKTYRKRVTTCLYGAALPFQLVLLTGATGVGKTALLRRLAQIGIQIIDLEALAAHRGSLFGGLAGRAQPSQKLFESRLLAEIDRLDPGRPVVMEAESSRIGQLMTPPALWQAMQTAPRLELEAPVAVRAARLCDDYRDLAADPSLLTPLIDRLPRHHSHAKLQYWRDLARQGQTLELALDLMQAHYDPAYRRSETLNPSRPSETFHLDALDAASLHQVAMSVAARIEPLQAPSPSAVRAKPPPDL